MKNYNKTAFITGSAGFIGFHLSKLLLTYNWRVIGIDGFLNYYDVNLKKKRHEILLRNKNFFAFEGKLEKIKFIEEIFNKFKPSWSSLFN